MRSPLDLTQATPQLVATCDEAADLAHTAGQAGEVALDIEASGMHGYRARACTLQLAWDGGRSIAIVDALATPITPLSSVLSAAGPMKIVHDVAFDARLLADAGVLLARVHDTAIAARLLGHTSIGLGSLLASELGVSIDKSLQLHDWRERPITADMMTYLSKDVACLEALEERLWSQVRARGIEEAVIEETNYRISCAFSAQQQRNGPGYLRIRGADRLSVRELAVLRSVFDARERHAMMLDVPVYRVAPPEALLALSRSRPETPAQVLGIRGLKAIPGAWEFAGAVLDAISHAGDTIPEDEWAILRPERPSAVLLNSRRAKKAKLLGWRRAQAAARGLDEQVVLPGHCLQGIVEADVSTLEDISRVPGIGAFRVELDGEAILSVLRGDPP
ncbi:MAG: HRDC domain-containing protein [Polyangiaceae bacterium]|jgi:ribonuclease D